MELDALIRALAPGDVIGRRDVEISELAYDTRTVRGGALFFCVPGSTRDGHDLAPEAVGEGAVALVVERPLEVAVPQLLVESTRVSMAVAADVFFGMPTERLTVAGVTGTSGKTSTTYLLRSILETSRRSTGLVGTVEWIVGGAALAALAPRSQERLLDDVVDVDPRARVPPGDHLTGATELVPVPVGASR